MTVADLSVCVTSWPARLRLALVLGTALILSACSSTPEWADPTAVWDNVFGEEEDARPADAAETDTDGSFASLGSTPKAPESSSAEERRAVANSLIADRDKAKYTDETLRAQGAAAVAPPTASAVRRAATEEADKAADAMRSKAEMAEKAAMSEARRATSEATQSVRPSGLESRAVTPTISSERMRVPSIVQRAGRPLPPPTPVEEVSRGRSPARIVQSGRTPEPQRLTDSMQDKAEEAMQAGKEETMQAADSAAQKMLQSGASDAMAAKSMASDRMASDSMTAASGSVGSALNSPAAMAAAANVNLPVGQDQQTLERVFASQVAAQSGGLGDHRASLPSTMVTSPGRGTAFPARPDNTAVAQPSYTGGAGQFAAVRGNGSLRPPGEPIVVRFGHSSTGLDGKARRQVDEVAAMVRERGGMVRVVGHASQHTADMPYARHKIVNFNVSLDRANAVARALTARGVSRGNIIVEARGDEEPLFYEFMPNGEAYNRRVEIFLQ